MPQSLTTELILALCSLVGLSPGVISSGSPAGPIGDAALSALTPAPQDGRPDTISDLVTATIIARCATYRSGPLTLLTLGPTLPG